MTNWMNLETVRGRWWILWHVVIRGKGMKFSVWFKEGDKPHAGDEGAECLSG